MSALRKAIIERLGVFDDLTCYWYDADEVEAPAVIVMPDRPFVDYQQAFRSRLAEWRFVLTLLVQRVDEEAAQEALDDYVDPHGPFVARLRETDVGDSLTELSQDFVTVTAGTNYAEHSRSGTAYLTAQIKVVVRA